jgi:hypothetical protein
LDLCTTFDSQFIDDSETRERLIEAVGEIDRELDNIYIPRRAMQVLIDEFEDLGRSKDSIWMKLLKMFIRFAKFLFGIFVQLVPVQVFWLWLMENLDKRRRAASHDPKSHVPGRQDCFSVPKYGIRGQSTCRYVVRILYSQNP